MQRKLMKIRTSILLLSLPLAIISCSKEEKKAADSTAKPSVDSIKTAKVEDKIDYTHFNIYNVSFISSAEKDQPADAFISVSDIYTEPKSIQEDLFKTEICSLGPDATSGTGRNPQEENAGWPSPY
jgi:hypothetical protein